MNQAILLVNLGTPEAPSAPALRRYLKQFLSDPRVVEIPRPIWWLILNGIILNLRPKQSARKYAQIWTAEGSPLKVHTEKQAKLLRGALGAAGHPDIPVAWAMRYGQPSVPAMLDKLQADGAGRIMVLPLYPQYAASTTASTFDAVCAWIKTRRNVPEFQLVRDYHDHPDYIGALAQSVLDHWMAHGRPDDNYRLVMSFHGLPKRCTDLGDPYQQECLATGRLLAQALGLSERQYAITFQSRFGAAEWLQPYTQPSLEELARKGVKRVDVICPGFAGDCLETLEEIGLECRDAYRAAGGGEFRYIPCLNERADWIAALKQIVLQRLAKS
jgi:ferrochelatase